MGYTQDHMLAHNSYLSFGSIAEGTYQIERVAAYHRHQVLCDLDALGVKVEVIMGTASVL